MNHSLPPGTSNRTLERFVLALADDELVLGHRDSEWTGYGPILEEDIAFSNIAQDEIGHSLVWFNLYKELTGAEPDAMVFRRRWNDFTCCRFVEYQKGDFGYTVVRQFLFDAAEKIRLESLLDSSFEPFAKLADRLLKEEAYHLLHSETLLTRLGNATEESSRRMQSAVDLAFPQSLGMFEAIDWEDELVQSSVFKGNERISIDWLKLVMPVLKSVDLIPPVKNDTGSFKPSCTPEYGGRKGNHTDHLKLLVDDLQKVYMTAPESQW